MEFPSGCNDRSARGFKVLSHGGTARLRTTRDNKPTGTGMGTHGPIDAGTSDVVDGGEDEKFEQKEGVGLPPHLVMPVEAV